MRFGRLPARRARRAAALHTELPRTACWSVAAAKHGHIVMVAAARALPNC